MWSGVKTWINERLPLGPVARWSLEEDIPGGASFAYVFGSANVILFLLLVVTGVLQLFYYVPTTDHGYESVMYLRLEVAFGWLVHGLHYWCAQAFVVSVGLHLAQVFIWGAYKNPRQMTWLTGVILLLLVAALTFTGPLLAWDQLGYWAAEVGTSIMGTVPWIGDFLQRFMRGGETMGQETLSRFFIFHVAILPALLVAFIILHLAAFRQFGGAGSWDVEKQRRVGKFWPDQVYKDILVAALIIILLADLCILWRAPIAGPADPVGRSLTPKPAWNFLFLYQALKSFKGPWEVLGTVGVPLAIVLLLFFLPFYDRNPQRHPLRRPITMAAGTAFVILILALTVLGQISGPAQGTTTGPSTSGTAPGPGTPAEPNARAQPNKSAAAAASLQKGHEIYQSSGCAACHKVNGQGGAVGPDLSEEGNKGRSVAWLVTQIRNPKANNPASIMPANSSLSQEQLESLAAYLLSLRGGAEKPAAEAGQKKEAAPAAGGTERQQLPASGRQGPPGEAAILIGSVKLGRMLFADYCNSCHGPEGTDKVPNPGSDKGMVPGLHRIDPNLFDEAPSVFAARIDRVIQHGSIPKGPHPALYMPAYGDGMTLTQPQIAALEAYLLDLNGVDRAAIIRPGVAPHRFFSWTMVALGAVCAVAIIQVLVRKWGAKQK